MFSSQISSIESQIQELTRKADQYRVLDSEMIAAMEAIARIKESAKALDVEGEVTEELASVVGVGNSDNLIAQQQEFTHQQEYVTELEEELATCKIEIENLAARYSKDFEALQQEKCDYREIARQWERCVQKYELPGNLLDSFLVSGESIFDTGSFDLQEIADNLATTPEWCIQSRLKHTFSIAHQNVQETLAQYLPSELADFWRVLQSQGTSTAITVEVAGKAISEEEEETLVDDGQLVNLVEDEPESGYETAEQISEALADTENLDTHLMAIASILDSCPAEEIPGRVWFFVQNIPSDFDDRILGYLPKSIRPEWDKQRTVLEEEARASIFPDAPVARTQELTEVPNTEKKLEIKSGDLVQIYSGETCEVLQAQDIGDRIYVEVKLPEGRKEAYRDTDLRLVDKAEQEAKKPINITTGDLVECPDGRVGHIESIEFVTDKRMASVVLPGGSQKYPVLELKYLGKYEHPKAEVKETSAKKTTAKAKKPATKATSADILKCKSWEEIRAIANNDPKIIKEAGAVASTKIEKQLIEDLPELIRDFMYETHDFSDLDWLPNYIKQRVRCLMSEPGTASA